LQTVISTETLIADSALERSLPRVDGSLVSMHIAISSESSIADGAMEGFLTGVHSRVLHFIAIGSEFLVAEITMKS